MEFSYLYVVSTIFVAIIIVFALSIVLQYIIKFQRFILNFLGNKNPVNKIEVVHKNEEYKKENEPLDDLEVVAVIVAALSSYIDISQSNLNIKSIKRVNNNCE